MYRYLVGRFLGAVVSILGAASLVFVILRLTSDPVAVLLPPEATREDAIRLAARLGLDQPLPTQYIRFLWNVVSGDLGNSFRFDEPVTTMILERIPATILLVGLAVLLALVIAIPAGIVSAFRRDTWIDAAVSVGSFLGFSIPSFWLGLMLIVLFSVKLGWLPSSGHGDWRHFVLPAVTLATWPLGQFTRLVRSEMLEVLSLDYIRTARAKGVGTMSVLVKHAFRNASLSLVTMVGLSVSSLLGGAIVTETIFAWPGMGRLIIQAVSNRDFPVIQASVVYFAVVFVLGNLVVDVFYSLLDPRIRFD